MDAALADAAARAGRHLACRPGCSQCCVGAFSINPLDAERLLRGHDELAQQDSARFERIRQRVADYVERTRSAFPGDAASGLLDDSPEAAEAFEDFANDEVCPVLDPEAGTCDLYGFRPMTCRVFGPPVRARSEDADEPHSDGAALGAAGAEGLGVCELCFTEASPEEIVAAELVADPEDLEWTLLEKLRIEAGKTKQTTVAYALSARNPSRLSPK